MPRLKKYELHGEPTPETVDRINEMLEELYRLLQDVAAHNITSTIHSDTLEDPEDTTVDRGDLLVGQTTPEGPDVIRWQTLALGDANTFLHSDGDDVEWANVDLSTADVTGILDVPNGGTGVSSLTDHAVLLGNGTSPIETVSGLGTSGQVLTSNGTGADPTWEDAATSSSGGGHLHGLQRVLGDGSTTTFNLLDIAEYLEHIAINGGIEDPATFTLSADGTQITFDTAPPLDEVIAMEYVIAGA